MIRFLFIRIPKHCLEQFLKRPWEKSVQYRMKILVSKVNLRAPWNEISTNETFYRTLNGQLWNLKGKWSPYRKSLNLSSPNPHPPGATQLILYGEAPPQCPTPYLFVYHFWEERYPFHTKCFCFKNKGKIFGLFNTLEALNRKFNYALIHSSATTFTYPN